MDDGDDDHPSSHRLAHSMAVNPRNVQVMKASFFGEEDVPSDIGKVWCLQL